MAYTKTIWEDRYIETPNKYVLTENQDNTVTLTESTGTVYTEGTEVNAANMNNIENGLEDVDTRVTTLEADTGWQNLSYASGFSAGTANQLKYRVKNGICYIKGGATGTFTSGTYTTVATLPQSITPSENIRSGAAGQQGKPALFEINSDGSIKLCPNILGTSIAVPTWIAFNTSYPID